MTPINDDPVGFVDQMRQVKNKLAAEVLGTFALVFIGAGAVVMESHTGMSHLGLPDGKVRLIGIAFAHGLTLIAMIYSFGSISGAHFNPAVSFAMWTQQKLKTSIFCGYVAAQVAGAILAGIFLAAIFPDEIALAGLGTPQLAAKISPFKGIGIEAIITFLLVTTILFATRNDNGDSPFAGLAIGSSLIAVILFAGPVTGGAANPARFIGPAVASGRLAELTVYIVGPLFGAAMASVAYWFVVTPNREETVVPEPAQSEAPAGGFPRHVDRFAGRQSTGDENAIIDEAHRLFEGGQWNEAVQVVVPLLWRFDQCRAEVKSSVRALLLVIENDAGKLDVLDKYRDLIYQGR